MKSLLRVGIVSFRMSFCLRCHLSNTCSTHVYIHAPPLLTKSQLQLDIIYRGRTWISSRKTLIPINFGQRTLRECQRKNVRGGIRGVSRGNSSKWSTVSSRKK